MALGTGIIQGKVTIQKISTKISIELDVVGARNYVPWIVWANWFLAAQGYAPRRIIFYQDNQSSMKMENSGQRLCREKSRHIHIRHFFVKDILKLEDIH